MRKSFRIMSSAVSVMAFAGVIGFSATTSADEKKKMSPLEQGKALAFNKKKGNCLACHIIAGGDQPGNIAPPLVAMKARFPDRTILRDRIWDATAINPDTRMPPFGRNRILSEDEIWRK